MLRVWAWLVMHNNKIIIINNNHTYENSLSSNIDIAVEMLFLSLSSVGNESKLNEVMVTIIAQLRTDHI